MKKGLRRVAAVAVTTLVAIPALAPVASATSTFSFDRLQGTDRYATSVATAAVYGGSANVILASGVPGHYADALTASYLAGSKKAPIMLTQFAATPANVLARIAAAGATDVWLVGGTGVISAAQEAALDVAYTVHRVGGLDRYLTSAAVIGAAGVATSTTHTAVLATGVNFPDALGGGALSYVKGMPMAITGTNTLPASTLSALKAAGVTNVIVLGGPTVITSAVINALAAQGITLNRRIYGADRAQTSAMLADYMITSQGFSSTAVNVASGYAFGGGADALGAAALSGKENRPTLITDSATVVGPGVMAFLTAHANTLLTGHIFGGTGAVSTDSATAMTTAARAATSNQAYPVTPSTAASIALSATTLSRQYTVSTGAATQVDVQLYPAANVTTSAGVVTFADTNRDNIADPGSPVGIVSLVNGVANTTFRANNVTPVAGQVTFTIRSAVVGSVIPVVYTDNKIASTGDNVLNLVAPTTANALRKQPSEAFGIGGATTWTPSTDKTAPSAPTITNPAGAVTVNAPNYTVTGVAEVGSTVTLTGGSAVATGTAAAVSGAYSIVVPLTQNAVNTISAKATDTSGNTSVASVARAVTEDSIVPGAPTVTTPSGAVTVNAVNFTVIGVAEARSTVRITGGSSTVIGTAAARGGAYSIVVPLTQNAVNTISVTATDAAGNTGGATTRAITEDSIAPVLTTATVNGATLVLTYATGPAPLDTTSTPAVGDFAVVVASGADVVTAVVVTGTTVTLTLTTAAVNGNVVTVGYTAGTNKIKDTVGNLAANLTAQTVTNNTP